MIQFVIGIIIGLILLPILLIFYPSRAVKRNKLIEYNLKTSSKKELTTIQAKNILKSLHQCTDLYWLNVLINRFWFELADSNAQAYRIKQRIKRLLDDIPGTGIIQSLDVVDIDIGNTGPIIKSIRIIDASERQHLGDAVDKNNFIFCKNLYKKFIKTDGLLDFDKIHNEVFKNVHAVISIEYKGSIKISLKIGLPKKFILNTEVNITRLEGNVLMRLPSLSYNTRLEYSFLTNPDLEVNIDGGVSKGEGNEYFKRTISNLLRRTFKFSVLQSFVYPSFNTIYLPLISADFKDLRHRIHKITPTTPVNQISIRESLEMFLALDYKIIKVVNDVTFRTNNMILNDKEKIYCAHFLIPECALNSSHFSSSNNYIYENLTIKESKIMNQIYDLSILNNVILSFKELNTIHNFNSTISLVELVFLDKKLEFIRIVYNNKIFFQRNDEKNHDFLIFYIENNTLYVYSFITSNIIKMTQSRIFKLKSKLEMKHYKEFSVNKLFRYSKNALNFWKPYVAPREKQDYVTDVKNIVNITSKHNVSSHFSDIDSFISVHIPKFFYKFEVSSDVIFSILNQDSVRLKFISEHTQIYRQISENDLYRSIAIESKNKEIKDFILHTHKKDNLICDVINNKKIVYEVKNDFQSEYVNINNIHNHNQKSMYSLPSNTEIDLHKKTQITFLNLNALSKLNTDCEIKDPINSVFTINRLPNAITLLNIYVEDEAFYSNINPLYESIYTRITHQKIFNFSQKSDFETLYIEKELRKDFFGDLGGVYIEFKTSKSDDFKFTLFSTVDKKDILKINKIITSKPVKMIIPIFHEDILLLKLVPKFNKNKTIDIKIVNLPKLYHRESLIDCNIGLTYKGHFTFPIVGSPSYIIFWEKEQDEHIKGFIESPFTKVPIKGNGTMRTDQMNYSIVYKNNGAKCREISIYMGVTLKNSN